MTISYAAVFLNRQTKTDNQTAIEMFDRAVVKIQASRRPTPSCSRRVNGRFFLFTPDEKHCGKRSFLLPSKG